MNSFSRSLLCSSFIYSYWHGSIWAWVKHKNIFNWVIFKENIAIFAENVFLTQKLCHGPNFHHEPSFIH